MKRLHFPTIFLTLILAFSLLAAPAQAIDFAQISPSVQSMEVEARNALLVNLTQDTVYYQKDARDKVYPASITKVMTALLVLEAVDRGDLSLDQEITAGSQTWDGIPIDGSTANIQIGETLTVEQLLYCLLLPSANEAANILAQTISGSISSFVDLMNQRSAELGCTGTHYVNPNGIHDPNHYTTCYDIYLIARQALENETFRTIVSTDEYRVPPTNKTEEERVLYNTNGLLTDKRYSGYLLEGCIGIKTGSTSDAGYCLLAAAERDGTTLLSVVMGAETIVDQDGTHRMQFSESARLLNWGFDSFAYQSVLESTDPVTEVPVTLSTERDYVLVIPQGDVEALLPTDVDLTQFTTSVQVVETVEAPVEQGQKLGTMTVSYGDEVIGSVDLVAQDSVSQSAFLARKQAVENFIARYWLWAAIGLAVLLVLILVLRLTVGRSKRRYGPGYTGQRVRGYKGRRRR